MQPTSAQHFRLFNKGEYYNIVVASQEYREYCESNGLDYKDAVSKTVLNVANSQQENGVLITHIFAVTAHFKGSYDGLGGNLKHYSSLVSILGGRLVANEEHLDGRSFPP